MTWPHASALFTCQKTVVGALESFTRSSCPLWYSYLKLQAVVRGASGFRVLSGYVSVSRLPWSLYV